MSKGFRGVHGKCCACFRRYCPPRPEWWDPEGFCVSSYMRVFGCVWQDTLKALYPIEDGQGFLLEEVTGYGVDAIQVRDGVHQHLL
eukprot:732138-Prorocentrum_minimum.AAC.2